MKDTSVDQEQSLDWLYRFRSQGPRVAKFSEWMGYPEEAMEWEECQDPEGKKACRQQSEEEEPEEETGKVQRDSMRMGQSEVCE